MPSPSHRPGLVRLILAFGLLVEFPTLGLFHVIDLPLDVLEDFVLQRAELAVSLEHVLVAAEKHVEPDELPFRDALGLLDVRERVALEHLAAVRPFLTELALFALDHILSFTESFRLC
jgi:hypothetical protein